MKQSIYIIATILFFSCSSDDSKISEGLEINYQTEKGMPAGNEIFHNGNTIIIEEVKDERDIANRSFSIQKIEQTDGDIRMTAKKIPTELYLRNQGITGEDLGLALDDLNDVQLFYFEFEETKKQDLVEKYFTEDLDGRISYMSFGIFEDFKLVSASGDTIPADYSIYERNYHIAPFERLIVSFSSVIPEDEMKLIYKDQVFGRGIKEFSFASENYLTENTL
ncbi:MAG: hypothetical protein JNJ99_02280 [Crocinitomicaceae bacterium]|nr:hypothetical protein [Crocinitomicaceae bacterium]